MGGTARGLSRRSFVAAGAVGIGALALRPRRTIAEVLDPRSPVGLWGVARTEDGLLGLWASGGRPAIVRLSDRGPVTVQQILATPAPGVAVAIAGGGTAAVLGAVEEVTPVDGSIRTDHLPPSVRAALAAEVDGPLSLAGAVVDEVSPRRAVARDLDGSTAEVDLPSIPGGVATSVLRHAGAAWSAVQHPPTVEGDHPSSLSVAAGGTTVLEIPDLGAAGPASIVGPVDAPLLTVVDGTGVLQAWRLGGAVVAVPSPGAADDVALHVADGRTIALLASPDGATLLGHGPAGWEVLRDVAGTAGCRRVLAVAGPEPEFLVEVADGVRLVDGRGEVR